MKNVILTGSSGMIGQLILENCLESQEVARVTTIVRRASGISHPKLVEVICEDFLDYSKITDQLQNQDVCYYCIGVYTGAVPRDTFRQITVDYTREFAEALIAQNQSLTFCFLSGQGADTTEKSRVMFAQDKGIAENILQKLPFKNLFIFRPGYIYPVTPRKEPSFSYRLLRWLYPSFLSKIYPNIGLSSVHLANVMTEIGLHGAPKIVYENKDIRLHPDTTPSK